MIFIDIKGKFMKIRSGWVTYLFKQKYVTLYCRYQLNLIF